MSELVPEAAEVTPDEVVADDAVVEEAVEEQATGFEEDVTHFGPDGRIDEEAEGEVEGAEAGEAGAEAGEGADEPTAGSQLETQPLQFRAYGKDVQVPGAVVVEVDLGEGKTETQIVMTQDTFQRHIQNRMPDPEKEAGMIREYESRIADLDPAHNETVIRAGVVAKNMDSTMAALEELANTDPDAAIRAVQNFSGLTKHWDLEIQNAILTSNATRQTSSTTSAGEQEKVAEWRGIIDSEMGTQSPGNVVDIMLTQAGIELPPTDVQLLRDYVSEHRGDYYLEATAEHAAQNAGITEGALVRNDPRLIRDLEHQIGLMQRPGAAKKAAAVEKANKRKIEGKTVPPTRSAKGKQGGAGSEHKPAETREEWRDKMGLPT